MKNQKIVLFILVFYIFFYSTLIFLYIPLSRIRDFHIRSSFAERTAVSTYIRVYIVFAVYIMLFIYHTMVRKYFSSFMRYFGVFTFFFLIRRIYCR